MSKTRLVLLMLLGVGVLLEIAAIYGSYHPLSPVGKPAIILQMLFLLVVPFIVWKMYGERLLRALVICTCVIYLVLWCIGMYRVYRD